MSFCDPVIAPMTRGHCEPTSSEVPMAPPSLLISAPSWHHPATPGPVPPSVLTGSLVAEPDVGGPSSLSSDRPLGSMSFPVIEA